MRKGIIRPLVICVFRKDDTILVVEGYDTVKDDYFYRPMGGGIEYGEKSSDALIREVEEELDADIFNLQYLGTTENIFTFNGEIGHEIVLVYDAAFTDNSLYHKPVLSVVEDNGQTYKAMWKSLTEFQDRLRLVPEGLSDLLQRNKMDAVSE